MLREAQASMSSGMLPKLGLDSVIWGLDLDFSNCMIDAAVCIKGKLINPM